MKQTAANVAVRMHLSISSDSILSSSVGNNNNNNNDNNNHNHKLVNEKLMRIIE